MEHDDLLAGDPGPAASRENLEGVLRRHLRRRRRLTGGIAAAVLAIGAGGGVAIGEAVASTGGGLPAAEGGTNQILPSTQYSPPHGGPTGSPAAAPAGLAWGSGGPLQTSSAVGTPTTSIEGYALCGSCGTRPGSGAAQRLFERSANGIDVRVYKVDYGYPMAAGGTALPRFGNCASQASLLVEVSDAGAVGELTVPYPATATRPVDLVTDQVVGVIEGSPMAVLVVRVGGGVTGVGARFATGAADQTAVVDGVAVLVAPMPAGQAAADSGARASVVAYGSSGRPVQSFTAPEAPAFAAAQDCVWPLIPAGGVHGSPSPGVSASTGSVAGSTAKP